jgi:hypothetical protein
MSSMVLPHRRGLAAAVAFGACLVFGPSAATAAPGDAGIASYSDSSSADTYEATITNSGSTSQRYDYVKVPAGTSVTGCAIVSASKSSTCSPNGAGPGTAEAVLGSGGLPPNGKLVFSFTTNISIPCGTGLEGGLNSTSDPSKYTIISFPFSGSCGGVSNEFILDVNKPAAGAKSVSFDADLPGPGQLGAILTAQGVPGRAAASKRTILGSRKVSITAAGKRKVTVKLNKKAKKLLKKKHRLKATLTVTFTPTGGKAASKAKKLTLRS